jgi:hypothetical protein
MALRQATEKIAAVLAKRLKEHLSILRPLFFPRKLFGTYMKSSITEEVLGSDKAFAELQELYITCCEKPFGLPKKLGAPLAPIPTEMEAAAYKYNLAVSESGGDVTNITSPSRWILSFKGEANVNRLRAMMSGEESKQAEIIKQALINHLSMVVFLNRFSNLKSLLEDLRYEVKITRLKDLGGLPVVLLRSPVEAFLPSNEFILQITQLSGIRAFQEIIDPEELENIVDPLKENLKDAASV